MVTMIGTSWPYYDFTPWSWKQKHGHGSVVYLQNLKFCLVHLSLNHTTNTCEHVGAWCLVLTTKIDEMREIYNNLLYIIADSHNDSTIGDLIEPK